MVEAVEDFGARAEPRPSSTFASAIECLIAEQEGRIFLWSPVVLTLGIWSYFSLPIEPAASVFLLTAIILSLLAVLTFRRRGGTVARLLIIFLVGFSLAKLRTEIVAQPMIAATTGEVRLSGVIEHVDRKSPRSAVVTLRITT